MTKAEIVRDWALSKVGCAYIFAANGQKCTPTYRQRQMAAKPAYAANIKKYCPVLSGKKMDCASCPYKDKPAYDCSGLTKEAAKLIGIVMPHGASGQWKGAYWDVKGTIDKMPLDKVCFVFNAMGSAYPMGHVGIYLGDGFVVDARGHAQGVMRTKLQSYAWDHFTISKNMLGEVINVPDQVDTAKQDTIRRGAKGTTVVELQGLLIKHGVTVNGAQIEADGVFGPITDKAVVAFQGSKGLKADGIVGPLTWAALQADIVDVEQPDPFYMFKVPNITAAQAMFICDNLRATYGECDMSVG